MDKSIKFEEVIELSLDEYIARNSDKFHDASNPYEIRESSFKADRRKHFEEAEDEDEDFPMSEDNSDLKYMQKDFENQFKSKFEDKPTQSKGNKTNITDLRGKIGSNVNVSDLREKLDTLPTKSNHPPNVIKTSEFMSFQPWNAQQNRNLDNAGNSQQQKYVPHWQRQPHPNFQRSKFLNANLKFSKTYQNVQRNCFPRKNIQNFLNASNNLPRNNQQNKKNLLLTVDGTVGANKPQPFPNPQMRNNRPANLTSAAISALDSAGGQRITTMDSNGIIPHRGGNSDIQSLLGFSRDVGRSMDLGVMAAKFLDFLQGGPVHKPMYDMKIQKEIKEIQGKPLMYTSGMEIVSSDGPGVENVKISPKDTGITLNCRFSQ